MEEEGRGRQAEKAPQMITHQFTRPTKSLIMLNHDQQTFELRQVSAHDAMDKIGVHIPIYYT